MNPPSFAQTDRPTIAFGHYGGKNDISGVTTWLERLILRLHQDGFPVVLYLQNFGSNVQESDLFQSLRQAGVTVEIVPRGLFLEEDVRGVLKFLNRYQPKIFLPQCLESMYCAAGIAGRSGLPWAMTIHSDDLYYWALAETIPPEMNGGAIVGVSDHLCQLVVQKRLTQNPHMIPCGVPVDSQKAGFSNSPFRVVYSGRVLEEQKRISLVLESMVQACRRSPDIEGIILGDGAKREASQQWVKEQGLGNRIHFLGRLPPAEVQAQLAQCQVLLLMSDYEGLPVALLEAMSSGVVPVVRAIPSGIPELVRDGETGILVDHTPESAATAIVHLSKHPELWTAYSSASRERVIHQYSEDVCYQRWLKVISELCDRSTVSYPLPIPKKIPLPRAHPFLSDFTKRQKHPSTVIKYWLNRGHNVADRLKSKFG
jgi:glycosyltransferase involved in cell wall biosynthesis